MPFTPVCGPRLLLGAGCDAKAMTKSMVRAAIEYARSEQLSSWHVLFPTEEIAASLDDCRSGTAPRLPVPLV